MFIHVVLFEIKAKEVRDYRKDSLMWARHAMKQKGFISYHTMKRFGFNNQYASVYEWKTKQGHERFMKKFHDLLVGKSKARVEVLGYYNLEAVDRIGLSGLKK